MILYGKGIPETGSFETKSPIEKSRAIGILEGLGKVKDLLPYAAVT